MINLISDTVTKPTPGMLDAMMHAKVGDDVFKEDPTVEELENKAAAIFGMEAGIYCPSGTMTNQIAIKMHTQPLDEVICEENSHIFQYELGGYGFLSGVAILPLRSDQGKLTATQVSQNVRPDADWLPNSKLVVLENTGNRTGGNYYFLNEIEAIKKTCTDNNLILHLDGARIFNALVETNDSPKTVGKLFDSISVCLSKGLGAPVGSVLLGKKDQIQKARKIRKVLGGGMRQAGYLAAAGIYALDNNINRLKEDHLKAKKLNEALTQCKFVASIKPVYTNIVIFELINNLTAAKFLSILKDKGIIGSHVSTHTVRFVTHLDVSSEMIDKVCDILLKINKDY